MADIVTFVEGALVAHSVNSYDFKNDQGEQIKGDTKRLFIVSDFDQAPVEVKVRDAGLFSSIVSANGPGSRVALECEVKAKARPGGGATAELFVIQAHKVEKAA